MRGHRNGTTGIGDSQAIFNQVRADHSEIWKEALVARGDIVAVNQATTPEPMVLVFMAVRTHVAATDSYAEESVFAAGQDQEQSGN